MRKEMRYVLEKGDKIRIIENQDGSLVHIDEEYTIKCKSKGLQRYELVEKGPDGETLYVIPGQFKVIIGNKLINPEEVIETIYITESGHEYYLH